MFKWFKFGVASITGLLILIGIIIGIAFTIVFNLYVDKQKKINDHISSGELIDSEKELQIEENPKQKKEDTLINHGILNKENFDRLEKGMSYKETVKILGGEGEKESERTNKDSSSITYQFKEGAYQGIKISAAYSDGELSHKDYSSYNMEESDVVISSDQFDQLKPGMSYDEVIEIVGGEGVLVFDYGFPESNYHSITYTYSGVNDNSDAQLTFDKNALSAKTQNRLE